MARAPKPGRFAAPEPRSYGIGEAIPLPEVPDLPDRLRAAIGRARALLGRAGLPTTGTVDLPGGGFRSLARHVVLQGHPRDGDIHLAARLIVAAEDVAAGGERVAHGLMELGRIDTLATIYYDEARKAALRGAKSKRREWAEMLAEYMTRTGEQMPGPDAPLAFSEDFAAYRECDDLTCIDIVTQSPQIVGRLKWDTFSRKYLSPARKKFGLI